MMKHLLLILCTMALSTGLRAQGANEREQVLVFQHSGEVNFFYASELDSIVFSNYDADSICHDEIVSQLFYAKDTTLLVPIAEIDSVAFGSRNEMVLNSAVHELADDVDFPWIIRTEDRTIFYRKDTPSHILPKAGEKLYYAGTNDLMPAGLVAKVSSVTALDDEVAVTLEEAQLSEIFDKLFYTGRIVMGEAVDDTKARSMKTSGQASDLYEYLPLKGDINLGPAGSVKVNGGTDLVGDFVVNPFRNYYHAHIKGNTNIGFEWALQSEDSDDFKSTSTPVRLHLPAIAYGAIHPVVYTHLFLEGKAELSFKYSMSRNYVFEYEWTRRNGKNEIRNSTPTGNDQQPHDEAKIELLLSGELYGGAELGIDLNLAGERAGVIFALKAGPYVKGELGFGVLRDLRNYDSEFHYNDNLDWGLKLRFNISAFAHESFFMWGNKVEYPLYEHEFTMFNHSVHLFPEYKKTRAIQAIAKDNAEISVATEVNNGIPYEVETGFEIINQDGEVIDSIFVEKPILANETEAQGFSTTFDLTELTGTDKDSLRVRPIFHYANHTISAASVSVLHDSNIMPITSYETNGATTFISGASVVGTAKDDSTVYCVGNYLPIPVSIYESIVPQEGITQGRHISDRKSLTGTWAGECNGEYITITFNDDEACSGTYSTGEETRSFTYNINKPQTGDVQLLFDEKTAIVITIISVDNAILKYKNKNDKQDYELNKQYSL